MANYKPDELIDYKYMCINDNCKQDSKILIIMKKYEDENEQEICLGCGEPMCNKGKDTEETFNVSLGKFSSLSMEGKKAVLKKRSKQDFKKNVKEKQHDLLKQTSGKP